MGTSRYHDHADVVRRLRALDATLNGGRGVETLRNIALFLELGHLDAARVEYVRDGDKLATYPAARDAVEAAIGCRPHGVVDCQSLICRRVRAMRGGG